ncbi:single-stranded DNA-binding protein [Rhizobium sp. CBN3]|uniref:single-stranded DNA-binding protein n=1 Tax=Rhizobium sp. CBN3 TaxID=3058045 RepID=UPI0026740CCC|nr:single-stranded DNA-binding protein [Rhizobium sp. CBN3]MDO3434366.1 single-stranded DNA-binding protein [Rhizobium sp. CBN3]
MAGSMNRATLIGHLGADPETRRTQDGRPIVSFNLATSETWRDKHTGDRKEATEWHRIVVFNEGLCDVAEKYIKKGAKVLIEGSIKTRKWQDQQGQDRYATEIVLSGFDSKLLMLDRQGSGRAPPPEGSDDYGSPSSRTNSYGGGAPAGSFSRDLDDDIPFAPEWR